MAIPRHKAWLGTRLVLGLSGPPLGNGREAEGQSPKYLRGSRRDQAFNRVVGSSTIVVPHTQQTNSECVSSWQGAGVGYAVREGETASEIVSV